MIRVKDVHLPLDGELKAACAKKLRVPERDILEARLLRRSVDARKKNDVHFTVTAAVSLRGSEKGYPPYVPWTAPSVTVLKARPAHRPIEGPSRLSAPGLRGRARRAAGRADTGPGRGRASAH